MRYLSVPKIPFIKNGVRIFVNDKRPLETYNTDNEVEVRQGDFLDEILTRPEGLGEDSEISSYQLIEHNSIALFDANWNLWSLKKIRVPKV